MENCIFCKIINHEIPGKVIYEDELCMAFLDLSQTTDGHTLIVPKKHFANILEVDHHTLGHMMSVAQNIMNTIQKNMNAKGFNVLTNVNEIAGQTVMHFHIHIIPRYEKDEGFQPQFTDRSQDVDLNEIYLKITNH